MLYQTIPENTTFEMKVFENQEFEFRVMIDLYYLDKMYRPNDIDKIGKVKFQIYNLFYDPIKNRNFESDEDIGFQNCYNSEIQNLLNKNQI